MSTDVATIPHLAPVLAAPRSVDLIALACTGLAEQSQDGYRKDLTHFALFCGTEDLNTSLFRFLALAEGQANAVALAYCGHMVDQKLAAATASRRLAAVRRLVKQARRVGLTQLPGLDVDSPKAEAFRDTSGPGAGGWGKMLDHAMMEAAGSRPKAVRDLAIVLLLHDRALRRTEVVELELVHFDADRPAVEVRGKGQSARTWLTINAPTRDAIAAWLAIRGTAPGPLFRAVDNRSQSRDVVPRPLDSESVNRLVGALAKRAKVARTVRAHGLRHSAITEALDSGFDVRDVRQFSRHAKIDTVLIYDDRRKDLGGEISRSLASRSSRRRPRR